MAWAVVTTTLPRGRHGAATVMRGWTAPLCVLALAAALGAGRTLEPVAMVACVAVALAGLAVCSRCGSLGWTRVGTVVEALYVAVCVGGLAASAGIGDSAAPAVCVSAACAVGAWSAAAFLARPAGPLEAPPSSASCIAVGAASLAVVARGTGEGAWLAAIVAGAGVVAVSDALAGGLQQRRPWVVGGLAASVAAVATALATTVQARGGVAAYSTHARTGALTAAGLLVARVWVTARERADALEAMRLVAAHHSTIAGELRVQSRLDPLTGVANRLALLERLEGAAARLEQRDRLACLLFIDLDDFKPVNDQLGHAAGDLLLGQVAERLVASSHTSDVVARIGGDEFAILVEDLTTLRHAEDLALAVLARLDPPFRVGAVELLLHASVGVAILSPERGASPAEIARSALNAADMAMYRAKRGGKHRYELADPQLAAKSWPGLDRGRRPGWPELSGSAPSEVLDRA